MSVLRSLRMPIVLVVTMACHSDGVSGPVRGFEFAAASHQCGPADGPATAVYLAPEPVNSTNPPKPFVRIYVSVGVDELSGHSWQLSNGGPGAAWLHSSDANQEVATAGYMFVSSVDSDKTVEGSVDLRFPDAGRISGRFHATWIPVIFLCG